ncbi:MAG: cytochrome c biogenesis protein ResB, partial [Planctomycetota bacterium]|nr:cytochrome c biogenesis protein ResB [Planctomycetota bacterium]
MATGSMPIPSLSTTHVVKSSVRETVWELLRALGSLKITVVMFLAANFLLFVGTLAQDEKSLPEVKAEYFNCWVAQVPFSDFFPVTVFGESTLTGWFPFPGGATIGLILLVNLIAAKATRFHIAAKGSRLLWGGVVSVVGGLLALLVILTGHQTDGLQGKPPIAYETVWQLMQIGSAVAAVGLAAVALSGKRRRLVRISLAIAALSAGGAAVGMLFGGESWRMNEPGLRIMWQLMQSSVASLVLLAGLIMVFGARGGNVLIHVAVGMLMFGQFVFGDRQIEERLNLVEGQTSNMVCRTDEIELACIEVAEETETTEPVTAISGRLLKARAGGEPIALKDLPFDIKVLEYLINTSVTRVGPFAENRATAGLGKSWLAIGRPPEGGASSKSNVAAAYVQLIDRKSGKDLGVFLVPQFLNDRSQLFMEAEGDICDTVDTASGPWRIQLRFRREYKPYEVRLDDVRRINYSASETPRDYSSFVTFTDEATGTEQPGRIWMNNPVRYRGETFFQSNYSKIQLADGSMSEMTGLQVVENAGWLIPYVACVLAFWGMLAHFGGTFVRFADRHEREGENKSPDNEAAATVGRDGMRGKKKRSSQIREPYILLQKGWLAPVLALSLVGLIALPAARVKKSSPDASDWSGAGEIPVMHEGRVKPLDTVARNTLQLLSNRTSVEMPETEQGPNGKISATQWLLAAMADSDWVGDAPVFRIDAREVLDLFDLTRRSGHRYTLNELQGGREALQKQIAKARELLPEERTFFQKKCAEINRKMMVYDVIRFAYDTPVPPRIDGADEEARQEAIEQLRLTIQRSRLLDNEHPPAVIPPQQGEPVDQVSAGPANEWQSLYSAVTRAMVARMFEGREGQPAYQPNPAIFPFLELLAVVDGQPSEFNGKLKEYKSAIRSFPAVKETAWKADFEAWYNGFNPTSISR